MTNIKYRYTIYLALLLLLAAFITTPATAGKHFFWKVQTDSSTAYLLGSIHMGKPDMYPLPAIINNAFDSSDVLVVEVNIKNVDLSEGSGMSDMMSEMMYTDSTTFRDHISDSLYRKFEELFKEYSVPEMLVQKMKPDVIIMTIYQMQLLKNGYSPNYGVDMHFLDKADSMGMEIKELETAEEQLKMLYGDENSDTSELYLMYSIDDLKSGSKAIDTLYNAWKNGNTAMIDSLTNAVAETNPEYKDMMYKLLDERNIKMAKKIEGYLATKKTYFIIVGAAHLVGNNGIISLLKKSGKYKIEQL